MADRVTPRTKLVFINNPLNPTGTIVVKKHLEQFLEKISPDVIVVLDEAYAEYVTDQSFPCSLEYLKRGHPVFILRTFSKIYGLAGLRIGYGIGPVRFVGWLNKIRAPFNTNLLAQCAACAALDDVAHLEKSLKNNRQGLTYLYGELDALGIEYLPTHANFFLLKLGDKTQHVYESLLREGVITRTMSGYGLPHYLRITVGLPSENERFARVLRKIVSQG
jgi:histidinol-phosphate aminotransferase